MALRDKWDWALRQLGADMHRADEAFAHLQALYSHPPRAYHNLDHVEDVCLQFADLSPRLNRVDKAIGLLAAFFHDAVYIPGASDNEFQSAQIAQSVLQELGIGDSAQVAAIILATADPLTEPSSEVAKCLVDADMSILASPPEEYEKYRHAIREEFGMFGDEDWRKGRAAFLRRLLSADRIYWSIPAEELEEPARINLRKELFALDPSDPVDV